ncbi:colanic acid biosynthesis glycosyltransferase WcaI [Spirosoma sp. KCTC 42546]|uniref:WcaI family glycosyltransferase n=1 Tax=Spirosoma sp. KCTC 42546 TaxID=2520506 RepID=UPI00115AFD8E|nr:WcaI family glycosyltransferase [Spirosoma sp. KCTC 42546]QDK78663.1 colanic acid biosynthesis glycosyltransferase WcaI [Spirosoma sp. KCTC 42546]
MRILIYDINYAPELTGVGKYTGEMGAWLASQGHTVRVITAMPYYPEWEVHDRYKDKGWFTEELEGVTVHRCPFYVPKKVTTLKRILHEFSFVLSSLPYWLNILVGKRYDAVISISPPFQIGLLPTLYSMIRKAPLWYHLQDLQVDMASELGMIKNKSFVDLLFSIEKFILKRSTVVSTISEGMVRKVADKNVLEAPCLLFPNWVDEQLIKPLPREASLRAEFSLRNQDKVILYSGSLGEKQGLELIIEAAKQFAARTDIRFLICGSGGGKTRLETLVTDYQLSNVSFHPLQPYEKLSALLATADIHLVLQKKSASDLVLPSKLTSILAAGGCALVSALPGTTLHDVINMHQMGILIEPESVQALIDGIGRALSEDVTSYQQNARAYARKYLSKEGILQAFEAELVKLQKNDSKHSATKNTEEIKLID